MTYLKELYQKYSREIYSYGISICHDKDLVEDTVHEVFVDVFSHLNAFSKAEDEKRYLMSAVRHKLYHVRKKKQENLDIALMEIAHPDNADDRLLGAEQARADNALVREMLSSLSMRQKEILYLRLHDRLSFKDISAIMDINRQSAQNLFQRAVGKLRRIFVGEKVMIEK